MNYFKSLYPKVGHSLIHHDTIKKGDPAMKFWNREKEKEWLKHYLKLEPNSIW